MRMDALMIPMLAASFRILNGLLTLMARGIFAAIRYGIRRSRKNVA